MSVLMSASQQFAKAHDLRIASDVFDGTMIIQITGRGLHLTASDTAEAGYFQVYGYRDRWLFRADAEDVRSLHATYVAAIKSAAKVDAGPCL